MKRADPVSAGALDRRSALAVLGGTGAAVVITGSTAPVSSAEAAGCVPAVPQVTEAHTGWMKNCSVLISARIRTPAWRGLALRSPSVFLCKI